MSGTKKQPLTLDYFDEFFIEEIKAKNYDLKAVNPNRKGSKDTRTPEELLSIIESQEEEIKKAVMTLKSRMF